MTPHVDQLEQDLAVVRLAITVQEDRLTGVKEQLTEGHTRRNCDRLLDALSAARDRRAALLVEVQVLEQMLNAQQQEVP